MIIALARDHSVLMLGLSNASVVRLVQGSPIKLDAATADLDLSKVTEIVIFHGPTEAEIRGQLIKAGAINDNTHERVLPREFGDDNA